MEKLKKKTKVVYPKISSSKYHPSFQYQTRDNEYGLFEEIP